MDSPEARHALRAALAARHHGAPAPLPRWVPPLTGLAGAVGLEALALPGTVVPATAAWRAATLAAGAILILVPVVLILRYQRRSGRVGPVVSRARAWAGAIWTIAACVVIIVVDWIYGYPWGLTAGAPLLGGEAWIRLAAGTRQPGR